MNTYNQTILHQHYLTAYCIVFSSTNIIGFTINWREASKICKKYPTQLQWDYITDLSELNGLKMITYKNFVYE